MKTEKMEHFEKFDDFCRALKGPGAFLVVQDSAGKPNPMTIGWSTMGIVWYEPIITVFVRPTRYTRGLMEKAKYFSVNVPVDAMKKELEYCGTHSGKDTDKIKKCGLRVSPGMIEGVSILEDCDLFYECETVHKNLVSGEALNPAIMNRYYPKKDFHTVYFGKILQSYKKLK